MKIKRYTITAPVAAIFSQDEDPRGRFCLASDVIEKIENTPSGPMTCPITGRKFFMNIQHPSLGYVATYGGPYDSYTIPVWDTYDKEFRSERFDHDAGDWVDGGEPYSIILVDEQLYIKLIEENEILKNTAGAVAVV